jgi:asparagine synthase (glutamine-hydrolysing)
MCGICGFLGPGRPGVLDEMTDSLAHRGPDDRGTFEGPGVGLGMRRLSIIDLGGGHQPISNEDGTLTIVFNGEIYNYAELREGLRQRGHRFSTRSDTEVILHLFEEEGSRCLDRLHGMFAIAIWDHARERLFLARDRLGIKPLYYAELPGQGLVFGSEIKALLRHPGWEPTVDLPAIVDYLALRYVPGPGSLLQDVRKLAAGHFAVVDRSGRVEPTCYWRPELVSGPFSGSDDEYLDEFAERFERSIRRRLISEVPVGAYLSGGIDSGTIVGAMSRLVDHPVRTFTVGFDYEHDELAHAREVAALLGTRHTEIQCGVADLALLPEIVYHLDEPVGDPIILPMYRLAREAKKQVTVILAGEGADEILGGYLFHRALLSGHRLATFLPAPIRERMLSPLVERLPLGWLDRFFDYPAALGERGRRKIADFLRLLAPERLPAAYRHLISLFDGRDTAALFAGPLAGIDARPEAPARTGPPGTPFLNRIIDLQFDHWLPDDILTKQDKLSMASGIEARVPFLDHELVEFALRVPPRLKIRGRTTKLLLRRYAARILPPAAVRRRKMPFYVPFERFLGSPPFRELLEDTLSEAAVRRRGLFDPEAIRRLRRLADEGRDFIYPKQLFSLVLLELWYRMAIDRRGRA